MEIGLRQLSGRPNLQSGRNENGSTGTARASATNDNTLVAGVGFYSARGYWFGFEAWTHIGYTCDQSLCYTVADKYDETSLQVRSSGGSSTTQMASKLKHIAWVRKMDAIGDMTETALQPKITRHWNPSVGEKTETTAAQSKIMQWLKKQGVLMECGGDFYGFVANPIQPLSLLQRCTAKICICTFRSVIDRRPCCVSFHVAS